MTDTDDDFNHCKECGCIIDHEVEYCTDHNEEEKEESIESNYPLEKDDLD
jgi:hypothetical protein